MERWLRCVDPISGPVTGVESSLLPGLFRPYYWFSVAKLSSSLCGAGWSCHKEESQKKAVTEAVERYTYLQAWDAPHDFGLDLDPTSTGFGASPPELGPQLAIESAYSESLERWVLHQWNDRPLGLHPWDTGAFPKLRKLFGRNHWELYAHRVYSPSFEHLPARGWHVVLSILRTAEGGIIPGSACSADPDQAVERAAIETYNHLRKIRRQALGQEPRSTQLPGRRLWAQAFHREIAQHTHRRLQASLALSEAESSAPKILKFHRVIPYAAPGYTVARVVVEGSVPINQGGLERLMI